MSLIQQKNSVNSWLEFYSQVRHESVLICEPLEIEDFCIQTMPEVSPIKWHLAHTSWFYETLILKPFLVGYKEFKPEYEILFNSYYESLGPQYPRHQRGALSRPTVEEVFSYRKHIDVHMAELLLQVDSASREIILSLVELGLHHEQQHQELMLTDILHIFASNPLKPVYTSSVSMRPHRVGRYKVAGTKWLNYEGGLTVVGNQSTEFVYDNEEPAHNVYLEPFQIASRPVLNGDYLEFVESDAYQQPSYWLSDAWRTIQQEKWQAPLYWQKDEGEWRQMTLSGVEDLDKDAPVCHISYFEAAAYARWKSLSEPGVRLPTEEEWESVAFNMAVQGNFRNLKSLRPMAATVLEDANQPSQMFGDVWEWTQSAYSNYPGYHAAKGPLGEYNGKFMSGQMVLRGGSCATHADHIRVTYRNFFYPHERWQFSGFRLAKDVK